VKRDDHRGGKAAETGRLHDALGPVLFRGIEKADSVAVDPHKGRIGDALAGET
jgi:glutamate/tyrosine decarboxylase-like PLP-dependent enzyme